MRVKALALLAAVVLLAACESPSSKNAGADAGGNGGLGGSGVGGIGSSGLGGGAGGVGANGIVPGTEQDLAANVGDRVFFSTDRSELSPEARATLDRQAGWLNRYPSVTVVIEGHADERGTREYNLALGDRRGAAVKNYLVAKGISAARLTVTSYGKERPAVVGSGEAAWAQNRRAVTVVN